jgi:hypothetical protein
MCAARGSVVGCGTVLQAEGRDFDSGKLVDFSVDLTLPAALCPWTLLNR